MSRQDKATTERHAKILRELVKRPENKVCADCKKNDPRWASWNIGVFLCIRCSGVHRSMGTHISKVKSVDLDTWTPEQMESIQKWGNYLANLYWEAHLKPGHIPPEHKIDSFIRSKYESRRWARDGSPPTDPSVLANGKQAPAQQQEPPPSTHVPTSSVSNRPAAATRPAQSHQLLSSNFNNNNNNSSPRQSSASTTPAAAAPQAPAPQPKTSANDLFSLDFHGPPASPPTSLTSTNTPKKDVKQDILSLFSAPQAAAPTPSPGVFGAGSSPWGGAQPQQHQPQPTSMIGSSGVGAWGTSSGWVGSPPPAQSNPWANPGSNAATPGSHSHLFNTSNVWNTSPPAGVSALSQDMTTLSVAGLNSSQKKDDTFGDIWGGFK